MKVCSKLLDSDEWNSAKLVSWAGKAKEKYIKAWNIQFTDGPVKPKDFERDVAEFQSIAETTNKNVESTNIEGQPINVTEEMYLADTYISETEKSKFNTKLVELESWKKQNVYIEENDIGQLCIPFN